MEKPGDNITLIKVPKFLATQWRNSQNHGVIGHCKRNVSGDLEEILVKHDGKTRVFKCRKAQLCNPKAVEVNESSTTVKSIGKFTKCLTVFPDLDKTYRNKLKERHINTNVQKARSTANETREDPSFDSSETIFKYYNPKMVTLSNAMGIETRTEDTSLMRSKIKSKKPVSVDMDELKMKIFKIFDTEEAKDGIQLKRVVQLTNKPLHSVKTAVEEIAFQKRYRVCSAITFPQA
ncbi:conserved hypothetical protein [Theileria equi strain WA]|uniref:Transcription initiation factor IIF subunit beta n=1 Tax=Theileria equi strain WA TaxID=1537102 RepID=L1LH09_THEEQ|nr:conserved hypothetical protein [Theileria equi strain WA]EKX74418.1 conserved hypothetical protein [Theileria equi strain WA]|eukprot:XP_004833870.1 conserved hypothetical protein [Theileria equi strain WA]